MSDVSKNPSSGLQNTDSARLSRQDWLLIVLLWVVALGMNMARPLTVDDPCFLAAARQLAADPANPYGYEFTVLEWPESGLYVPCPPVVPVVNAVCIVLFGVNEQALKAWMTPFAFLLIWSMVKLARPWAGRWLYPGVLVVLTGPVVLPALRLMIDIPAASMTMAALALFRDYLQGVGGRWTLAASILVSALAPLTKYTGFSLFPAIVLMAWLYGRPVLGLASVGIASLAFIGWEIWAYLTFGVTHMAYQADAITTDKDMYWMLQGLVGLSANGMPVLLGAAAYALGLRPIVWVGLTIAGMTSTGLLLVTQVPEWVYKIQSLFLWLGIGWMACRLLGWVQISDGHQADTDNADADDTAESQASSNSRGVMENPLTIDRFVVGLLMIELLVMFVISPFPAYRRLIGVMLAAGLVVSRYGSKTRPAPSWPAATFLVGCSLLSSLLCYYAERGFAIGIVQAMTQAKAYVASQPKPAQLYAAGRWSVPFYAEQMSIPEAILDKTALKPGDMVLVATGGMYMPIVSIEPGSLEQITRFQPTLHFPLNPVGIYGGTSGLGHNQDVGVEFTLWKVLKPTVLRVQPTPETMALGILTRKWPPSPLVSWSLLEFAMQEPDPFANPYAKKLLSWGDPFILRALEHPSSRARLWVLTLLEQNPGAMSEQVRASVINHRDDPQENPRVRQAAGVLVQ
jgi:4-amino-4-deoxy-L-arabinose transferase-like glycosyltransferase